MIKLNSWVESLRSCFLILLQISLSLADDHDGRIVGGVNANIEDASYLVQLRSNDFIFCSGALVSEYYVISAAHCFNKRPVKFTVVGGATKIYKDPGSVRSHVSAYVIPKDYNQTTYDKDLAIIKLKQPMVGALVKPISMDCEPLKAGNEVKLFGWGKRGENDTSIPTQLQTVTVKLVEYKWCKVLYFRNRTITNRMFCAQDRGKDACSGDSGGPAVVKNKLCGVVSWGLGCARDKFPGVYTNLRKFSGFVQRAMGLLAAY